jgi:ParB family chromosome partitioning protein
MAREKSVTVKNKGLGRGLDALLAIRTPFNQEIQSTENYKDTHVAQLGNIQNIPLQDIKPGCYQPRLHMDDEALDALAASIRTQGVIQPIVVRQQPNEIGFELIAGERRWRAAQRAGLDTIPAIIRVLPNETVLAVALVENIQREALDPIEEARGFRRLADEFYLTHEQIAQIIGRSRTSISNTLRLLSLPESIQEMLHTHKIEMGHARALLTLPEHEQIHLAHETVKRQWTVRDVEKKVKDILRQTSESSLPKKQQDPNIHVLAQKLSDLLGTSVSLQHQSSKGAGTLSIRYSNLDELDRLLERMQCTPQELD